MRASSFILLVALTLMPRYGATKAMTEWQRFTQPIAGEANAIGSFNNGCLIGAQPLPTSQKNYQIMRPQKQRYYGHPTLIAFISELAQRTQQQKLGYLLIGDMAMPAGGRFVGGHASHQTGLDVDIWLQLPQKAWSTQQLADPSPLDLVTKTGRSVNAKHWQPQIATLIQLAAEDPRVTRIFVHPAIKQQLCREADDEHRDWLRKIRPWFGHRAHMHVRLQCPSGSEACLEQAPPPSGDGCGEELESWFKPPKPTTPSAPKITPVLPDVCQQLLEN